MIMIKNNKCLKQNCQEPQGVLPLEGCMAEISHQHNEGPKIFCFVIIMKKSIFEDQIQIHSSYLFAAESIEDCESWVG